MHHHQPPTRARHDEVNHPLNQGDPRHDRFCSGFTVLELMVTATTIVLLLVLALPAFNRAAESSKNAKCISNLNAIGGALIAYANDHDGDLPPCAALPNSGYKISYRKKTFWFDALNPYLGFPGYAADRNEQFPEPDTTGGVFPFPWQLCPSKTVRPLERQSVGYGWNSMNFGLDFSRASTTGFGARLNQIAAPSTTIIVGDSKDADFEPQNTYQHRYIYDYDTEKRVAYPERHHGGGNYLFVDGHVEWFSSAQLKTPAVVKLFKRTNK